MKWYGFTPKGVRWMKSHDCDELIKSFFAVSHVTGNEVATINIVPCSDGTYEVSPGGALWGDSFVKFEKNDSFYKEVNGPTLPDTLYLCELGVRTWHMPMTKDDEDWANVVRKLFKGKTLVTGIKTKVVLQLDITLKGVILTVLDR